MPIGSAVWRRSVLFVNIGPGREIIQRFLQLSLKLHVFRTPVPVNNSLQRLEFLFFETSIGELARLLEEPAADLSDNAEDADGSA